MKFQGISAFNLILVIVLCSFVSFNDAFKLQTHNDISVSSQGYLEKVSFRKKHHPTLTYFRRLTENGEYVDRSSKLYGSDIDLPKIQDWAAVKLSSYLHVNPSENVPNGGEVVLTWKDVSQPSEKDWIGFYCPRNDTSQTHLDYFVVSKISSTWHRGYGSIQGRVYNMRSDCEFRYHRKATEVEVIGRSNPILFQGGNNAALQGRLMLTGNATQMRVMWTSGYDGHVFVLFGTSKDHLKHKANGTSSTYAASDMCGAPASTTGFRDPGYMHDALLESLIPGKRYFYSFGSEKIMSPVYNFTTPIAAGDFTPYTFIMYGDMGASKDAEVMAKNIAKDLEPANAKLVYHIGDISYAEGMAYIWDQWHELIQPYSTLMPYMVGVGNHEQDHRTGGAKDPSGAPGEGFHPVWGNFGTDSGGECGVPMYKRFHMPDNGNKVWWYSFDYGMVHFIMISTEHNFEQGSRQYLWLENDLKKVDSKKTPWVMIGGHRAMYSSGMILSDFIVSEQMKKSFEGLLHEYKVDMAFWAHYHSYERTCKVYQKKCAADGTMHIVAGTGGASLDKTSWFNEPWSDLRFKDHGYARLHVANATALRFEWVRNKDQTVMDSFWLTK